MSEAFTIPEDGIRDLDSTAEGSLSAYSVSASPVYRKMPNAAACPILPKGVRPPQCCCR